MAECTAEARVLTDIAQSTEKYAKTESGVLTVPEALFLVELAKIPGVEGKNAVLDGIAKCNVQDRKEQSWLPELTVSDEPRYMDSRNANVKHIKGSQGFDVRARYNH